MKIFYKTFFIVFLVTLANSISAASLDFSISKNDVSIGEEFYVDVSLDTKGKSINGIESNIIYDKSILEFIRPENSHSFITYWIKEPNVESPGVINFSGISPNGFSGFLNKPGTNQNSGNVTRLIFKPVGSGGTKLLVRDGFTTENNGEGTLDNLPKNSIDISVNYKIKNQNYVVQDINDPILVAEIVKDENLYKNQRTLVFNAIDKDSGVDGVYIKYSGEWMRITSPYDLSGISNHTILTVKAVDYTGNTALKRFVLPGYGSNRSYGFVLIVCFIVLAGLYLLYKVYVKKK